MISKLIKKNNYYVCDNCMLRQPELRANCTFCGSLFSNWEEIAYREVMMDVEEERRKNESNIFRRN